MDDKTQTLRDALAAQGWAMKAQCIDPGSYKAPNRWRVTITREGYPGSFETEYTQGAAHRRWTRTLTDTEKRGQFSGDCRKGDRAPMMLDRVTLHQEALLNNDTEPTPPELDSVLYCLTLDAGTVRHGQTFEEFAADMGYDEDSRKAESIYNACTNAWRALIRLGADFEQLDELFQDF